MLVKIEIGGGNMSGGGGRESVDEGEGGSDEWCCGWGTNTVPTPFQSSSLPIIEKNHWSKPLYLDALVLLALLQALEGMVRDWTEHIQVATAALCDWPQLWQQDHASEMSGHYYP